MKRKQQLFGWMFTGLGIVILMLALACYAFGDQPVTMALGQADVALDKGLVAMGACVIGIVLIVWGVCGLWIKQSKQAGIEAKDERHIALANEAKARGYEIMTVLFSTALAATAFLGLISAPVFFLFFAVYVVSQVVFIVRLQQLHKTK